MSGSAAPSSSIAEVPVLLTVAEVASTLRVEATTVYRYIRSGGLRGVRFGGSVRVPIDALREFVKVQNT
jgi:excisionase family DNA binding protein